MDEKNKDIIKRIEDFNYDFRSTLLDKMVIKSISYQFLDDDADYFSSSTGWKSIFNRLKQRRTIAANLKTSYNYLLIKEGLFADSDIFDKDNAQSLIKTIKQTESLSVEKGTFLFTISSADINNDNFHDLFIFCVFQITKDMPVNSEYFKDKMTQFLKYPLDFFNSPIVEKYFTSIKYKQEVGNYAHTLYNTLPNTFIIIEDMVTFIAKNHPNSDAYRKITKAHKGLKVADLSMRILAGKEIDYIKGKNIKGIMDFITSCSLLGDGITCQFNIDNYNEHLDTPRIGVEVEIFSILFNLWSNASKCKAYVTYKSSEMAFHVKMWHDSNGILRISFRNPCNTPKPQAEIRKLLFGDTTHEYQSKGLYYMSDNIKRLGWAFDPNSAVHEEEVEIIVLTK